MAWNWKTSVSMVIVSLLVQLVVCKPVDRAKPTPAPEEDKPKSEEEMVRNAQRQLQTMVIIVAY